ncbi:winged helix-turn-helix transcriptional regulator [Paenibacillus spongiae]|uniref:Helix-turn-helix transcriptional regulator n=1 Tax=Paenibacillus spongiae TaxID=2909671 RepID=A0ABY5SD16_9BACL|nr:helix-turn-helix domain-containing protein [Paenibacillus spongiae]UVI31559.1 helix-turn-helix transcriptional regulator [Paenibacillus spongiae]
MNRNDEQICLAAVNEALQVIGSKWAFLVISQLYYGPQRFNQLRRSLSKSNISIKSLTDILRHLEHYKIVNRQVFPTIPISVEYSLTEKGKEYRTILLQMREWGEKWITTPNN